MSKTFFFLKKKKVFKTSASTSYKLKNSNAKKIYQNINNIANYSSKKKFIHSSKKIPSYITKLYFIKYNN